MKTDSPTLPFPRIPPVKDTDGFKWAGQIVPTIPKIFLSVEQDEEGRFVHPQFEGIMGILAIRGAVADRVINIEDAAGEIQVIEGDLTDNRERLENADQFTSGDKLRLDGNVRRGLARQAYLAENIDRWKLELKAFKALLTGAGCHGV